VFPTNQSKWAFKISTIINNSQLGPNGLSLKLVFAFSGSWARQVATGRANWTSDTLRLCMNEPSIYCISYWYMYSTC
jgi:hypothetical protein